MPGTDGGRHFRGTGIEPSGGSTFAWTGSAFSGTVEPKGRGGHDQ